MQFLRRVYGMWLYIYRGLFLYPQKKLSADLQEDYDAYWHQRRGIQGRPLTLWQKTRADLVLGYLANEKGPLTIGDVGSGEGTILKYLKDSLPAVKNVIGYDDSRVAREWANSIGVTTLPLDIRQPGWSQGLREADFFLLMEVIEHVPNSEEITLASLAKAHRGVFITVPNTGFILYRLRLLLGSFPTQWVVKPSEHVRFWTLRDMRWWMSSLSLKGEVRGYRGVAPLTLLWPSLFAPGIFVYVQKD